jgi:hypothetical protein
MADTYKKLGSTSEPWSNGAKIFVVCLALFTFAAVVIIGLILGGVIQYPSAIPPSSTVPPTTSELPKPPANNLLLQGENLIKEMFQGTTDLAKIFNDYAKERLDNEIIANNAYNLANNTLKTVEQAQIKCKDAYSTLNNPQAQYTIPPSTISSNALTISNALGNIQSIINQQGTTFPPTPSGPYGSEFGTSLLQIENIKRDAYSAYGSIQSQIDFVVKAVTDTQASQTTVASELSKAKKAYNDLNDFLTTVFSTYRETVQYKNLKRSIDNAIFLSKQIQDLLDSQGGSYNYSQSLRNLKINLDNSITTASSYLNNVNLLYDLLSTNDKSNVNQNVLRIAEIFTKVLNIIGTYKAGSLSSYNPVPFSTPVTIGTPPTNNSILFYYNNVITMNINAITQYNNLLTTYNQVIDNINSIQRLSDGVFSSMINNSTITNNALLSSQESLRPFFPGSTTPGVSTYTTQPPLPTEQIPTLTPISLPAYTTMNVVYQ